MNRPVLVFEVAGVAANPAAAGFPLGDYAQAVPLAGLMLMLSGRRSAECELRSDPAHFGKCPASVRLCPPLPRDLQKASARECMGRGKWGSAPWGCRRP